MSHDRPTISTHVLDVAAGRPRPGVRVRLLRLQGDRASVAGEGRTDGDGRIPDLLAGRTLEAGAYRLEFALDAEGFFAAVALDVRVDDAGRSHHVPLLVSPFGLTTYRGS